MFVPGLSEIIKSVLFKALPESATASFSLALSVTFKSSAEAKLAGTNNMNDNSTSIINSFS